MTREAVAEAETMRRINAFIDELHRDIYTGYYEQKLTIEQLANVMRMSGETIKEIIATYQKKLDEGKVS